MYIHVVTYHLDLGQLWRCPVSWCTVWKGTPQDCMDHVRGAHDVPWDIKSASLEKFSPPCTVKRQIWTNALKPCHSGVSTDVLLFSDINLSLAHHYRVKRGLPPLAFRRDYLACLRVLVSQATALAQCDMASRFRPARFQHAMLAPLRWSPSRLGRPDVPITGCGLLMFGTNLSVSSFQP